MDLLAVQPEVQEVQESSPAPQFKSINSSALSFLYSPTLTSIRHDENWLGSTQSKIVEDLISSEPLASSHTSMLNNTPTNAMIVLKAKLLVVQFCPALCDPIAWTIACQAPLSMKFSRQEYWNGQPFPSPGDLPYPGIEPRSPALQADKFLTI